MGTIKLKKTSGSVSDPETRSEQACEIAADVGNAGLQSGAPRVRWEDPSVLKEYEGQTSGISRHFKLNNGTAQSVFSAMPVNYFDETEQKWKPIDNSLAEKAQSYESACGSVRTEIAKPQHGKSVKMTSPEFAVTWEYLGKQSEQPVQIAVAAAAAPVQTELLVEAQTRGNLQSKGSSATYVNADRDTDIEYSLAGNNIKENIVIKERAEDYRYLFALRTDGLKLRVSEDNENLELYSEMVDASGKTVEKQQAVIPAPFMYDAAGESSSEVYFELVPQDEGGYHFAVVASAEWINAENRAFPVTIDPVFVTSGEGCVTKQVQCRNVYTCGSGSGSGTGTTTSAWRNVDSIFVKVSKTTTMEYKSILTVKKSLMTLLDYEISSVKLRLIPYRVVSSGRFYVNNTLVNTTTSALECDITGAFKTSSGDFTVSLVPYSYSYANIDFYDSGVNAPSIVVEYLVNGKEKPVSQQFALAGGLVGEYNVLTGDIAAHFTDVPASDSVLGFGISHIYKKSSSDFHFGKNIRLNLNETLSQSGAAALGADYVYTDAYGNKHGFKDTYYYINQSGVKTSVAKSSVTVDLSGKLTYIVGGTEYEVRKEQRTKSGLTASTRLEGFRNNAYLEQRLDEVKQVEEQKEYYQNLLREFVTVDGDTGLICCYLRQYLYGHYAFERFMNTANGRYKLMTEDEALRLHDLILQLESFDLPAESGSTASSEEEQDQISQFKSSQKMSCRNQIAKLKNKHASYCDQVQKYYKEYVNLEHKLEQLERQTPVHYLTDGKTVKGFNESGRLVAVYDRRENVMTIEYDDDNRIVGVHDGEERSIALEYRPDGRLSSITDTRGRQTVYGYTAGYLTQVEFPDGRTVTLEYEGDDLSKVYSSEYGLSELDYTSASEVVVLSKSGIKSISHGAPTENKVGGEVVYAQTGKVTFRHGDNQTELEDDKQNRKVYRFDADENLYEYYEEEGGVVVKAEKYDYVPYEKDNVQSAARGSLYMKSVEAFKGSDFTGGDTVTVVLNEFNQPVTSATNARPLSVGTTQQTSVAYEYDEEHRCVRETASVSVQDGSVLLEEYQTVAACAYGMTGDVVRRESYVKGEEHTTGRTIEESEYDEKGNLIRTYTYNSLDSASKFYTESRYGENGQVLADKDESGEHETEYEYIEGTNVVREQKLPNGSRFAYGHDENDTVTAITQSTEEGEANSTQTGYTCGLVTELVSGNNRVNYTYDGKGRVTRVDLSGTVGYLENIYTDGSTEDKIRTQYAPRETNGPSDIFEVSRDKQGKVKSVKYAYAAKETSSPAYTELYTNQYDNKNRLTKVMQGTTQLEKLEYDDLDRLTSHTFGGNTHAVEYDDFGQKKKDIINLAGSSLEYTYSYRDTAARTLSGMTVGGFAESYEQDPVGRTGIISQTLGGKTYTKRYGYYKNGDHATGRVNTIYYGRDGVTDSKVTYTYDNMGNVISVNKDGKQIQKYGYDKLNRIIFEKNLDKNKEVSYTYDNQGNILTKEENGTKIDYRYQEGTDKLVSFGGETFAYDGMGNPTTYRNMQCVWEKGRQLKSVTDGANTVTYTYDVNGLRTSKTVGNETTSYVYENGKLLREETGSEVIDFIYGHDGFIGIKIDETNYLYRKNLFGDVTEIYNRSGELVGKYSYSAFGECTIELDTNGIATKNPIRYRGYYYDEETKLYYLKSRYYDPEIGRFITIDDTLYLNPQIINGLNLYAYCGNNPVMNVDPQGTSFWSVIGGIFKFLGGLVLGLIGAAIALVTLPVAIAIPGGGIFTQIGFSTALYGGLVMASVFDSQINADMEAINWNPFNSDASKTGNKVSFYKGMPMVWTNHSNGRSFSFLGIWLTGSNNENSIRHEWGHGVQQWIMGPLKFGLWIGLPSAAEFGKNKWPTFPDYYLRPWETGADIFGGVAPRTDGYTARMQADENRSWWYLAVAMMFGPFAYLFAI